MPSSRPTCGARSRRLLFALAILVIAGPNPRIEGDDSPAGNESARVEINGGPRPQAPKQKTGHLEIDLSDSKDVTVDVRPARHKKGLIIDLGDSKDATVEIVRERPGANVEINGYQVRSRFKPSRRYLFGQEQILNPPLPPTQFNPDPGGGNLLEPVEPPDTAV